MPKGKNNRLQQWTNYRLRVTLQDSRMFVGTFKAFDRHMNLVLADCDEYRLLKTKGSDKMKEVKRSLGFLMLRGENVVSVSAEAPPAPTPRRAGEGPTPGASRGVPAGRGVPIAPLSAAPAGLGGAAPIGMGSAAQGWGLQMPVQAGIPPPTAGSQQKW